MSINTNNPIIVQSDLSILLEVHNPIYEVCRDFLSRFTEIEKTPEHIHTYRISELSIWNAASSNVSIDFITSGLNEYSKYPVPVNVFIFINDAYGKFGKLKMLKSSDPNILVIKIADKFIFNQLKNDQKLESFWVKPPAKNTFFIELKNRGLFKQALIKIGFPVLDEAGFKTGDFLEIKSSSDVFQYRPYQIEASKVFYQGGAATGGHGVIVLPCGSGKTIVGIAIIELIKYTTLIITTNVAAVHQWKDELLQKTNITEDQIGEYTGKIKNVQPITITTYQMLTYRKTKTSEFKHLSLFTNNNWGLIIYDEVHLLPAPVFRATAEIQAKRRLGLTATLVREDGKEDEVFALIGPKKYDIPWKEMEQQGYIAEAKCFEIRIDLPDELKMVYALADEKQRFRIASENSFKEKVVEQMFIRHANDSILIIGQYINQLENISKKFNLPIITGKVKNDERERLYKDFRIGKIKCLVVSKVANFAIDLPDANVIFQISGTYGSRQEEAQRLGRILRPKKKNSYFYTIVSKDTKEQDFALNRQLFLANQGYKYTIEIWNYDEFI